MNLLPLVAVLVLGGCTQKASPKVETGFVFLDLDNDFDGWTETTDCNDADPEINPGAVEVCDGADNNCDGTIDEPSAVDAVDWYTDSDVDGYGDPNLKESHGCYAPKGFAPNGDDCDDGDPAIHPGASESCDGIDNNCDGEVDLGVTTTFFLDADADAYGNPDVATEACSPPVGYVDNGFDCDDDDPAEHPGAVWYPDNDDDGWAISGTEIISCLRPDHYASSIGDCDDTRAEFNPDVPEICDDLDNDCDTLTDESDAQDASIWYPDADGDDHGSTVPGADVHACVQPIGYVAVGTDCDDTDATVNPDARELCFNGGDDNCDGVVDENCPIDVCASVTNGTISVSTTWSASNAWYVSCDLKVQGGSTPVLEIEGGTSVTFGPGASLSVGSTQPGALVVQGRAGQPVDFASGIYFTDPYSSGSPGDWDGVTMGPYTSTSGTQIEYLTISQAGTGGHAGLLLDAADVFLSNVVIQEGAGPGLYLQNGAMPDINVLGIYDGLDVGIYVDDNSGFDSMSGVVISGNLAYAMDMLPSAAANLDPSTSIDNPGYDWVALRAETLDADLSLVALDVPYHVNGDISVVGSSDPLLTLDDGVVMEFVRGAGFAIGSSGVAGGFVADGTSVGVRLLAQDDAQGWDGITVNLAASTVALLGTEISSGGVSTGAINVVGNASVSLDDVFIHGSKTAGIYAGQDSTLEVVNSDISENATFGIYMDDDALLVPGSLPSFTNNQLLDNGSYPLALSVTQLGAVDDNNSFVGNGTNAIRVWADVVGGSATWRDPGVDYVVGSLSALVDEIDIGGSGSPVVTVLPGVTFLMGPNFGLVVGDSAFGTGALVTQGTPTDPVSFLSEGGCVNNGEWKGIEFLAATISSATVLSGLAVDCGGSSGNGNVYVYDGSSPTLRDCTITRSGSNGVMVNRNSAALKMERCTVDGNDEFGVYVSNLGSIQTFTGNVLTNNQAPLYLNANDVRKLDVASTYSPNIDDAIHVAAGSITSTTTWYDLDSPSITSPAYYFLGEVVVSSGATLTLEDGALLEFGSGGKLTIGLSSASVGSLVVAGTVVDPVVFTSRSASPQAGDWPGIYIKSYCGTASLQGFIVEYGGGSGFQGNIYSRCNPTTIRDATIRNSASCGVYCGGGYVTRTNVNYSSNAGGNECGC